MDVALILQRPDGRHRTFSLGRPETVIGRRPDCDLRIPLTDVSRKHCRLTLDAAGLQVSDLGSSNGTFVNGHKVTEEDLDAGDKLQVGPVTFTVQIDGQPDPATLAAPDPSPAVGSGDAVGSDELEFLDDEDDASGSDIIDLGADEK